ncbi:unnamed protein product, partial [Polarella glacialis]
ALQQRIKAAHVTARWVEASYWSSDHSACELASPSRPTAVPLLVLGDALGGKPFYSGSTLNRHLWDVANLIDEIEFAFNGAPLDAGRFAMHERRYQEYLKRIPEFHRGRALFPQPPQRSSLCHCLRSPVVDRSQLAILLLCGNTGIWQLIPLGRIRFEIASISRTSHPTSLKCNCRHNSTADKCTADKNTLVLSPVFS